MPRSFLSSFNFPEVSPPPVSPDSISFIFFLISLILLGYVNVTMDDEEADYDVQPQIGFGAAVVGEEADPDVGGAHHFPGLSFYISEQAERRWR